MSEYQIAVDNDHQKVSWLIIPPTLKKLKGHVALGVSAIPFLCPLQKISYSFEIS